VPLQVVNWKATCRRGNQELSVHLKTNETTPPVVVQNEYMNDIDALVVRPALSDPVELKVGESKSGLRVIGTASSGLESRFWPDLTAREECLSMAIADQSIASLGHTDTVSIQGAAAGSTTWDVLLGGSTSHGPGLAVPDVKLSTRIHVTDPNNVKTPLNLGKTTALRVTLHGVFGANPYDQLSAMYYPQPNPTLAPGEQVVWGGTSFTQSISRHSSSKDANSGIVTTDESSQQASGEVSPDGKTLTSLSTSTKTTTTKTWAADSQGHSQVSVDVWTYEITLQNVPAYGVVDDPVQYSYSANAPDAATRIVSLKVTEVTSVDGTVLSSKEYPAQKITDLIVAFTAPK